jgi:uncharacterized damage-inducible protein DinB
MAEFTTLLEETLEAWQGARMGVIEELENIPAAKFDFRPAKDVRSVKELAIHILEVAMLMTGELTRPDTNFRRAPWPKLLDMYAAPAYRLTSKQQILKFMRTQLKEGTKAFRKAGELHMLQFIKRFDGKPGTRLAWLHHGIDQEMYHRGQLTTYARLLGLEPALTKRIKG